MDRKKRKGTRGKRIWEKIIKRGFFKLMNDMALQSQEAPLLPSSVSLDIFRVKLQNTKDKEKIITAKEKDCLFTNDEFLEAAKKKLKKLLCAERKLLLIYLPIGLFIYIHSQQNNLSKMGIK